MSLGPAMRASNLADLPPPIRETPHAQFSENVAGFSHPQDGPGTAADALEISFTAVLPDNRTTRRR